MFQQRSLAVVLLATSICYVIGDAKSDIQTIQEEFWAWRMRETPEFATFVGQNAYNDILDNYTMSAYAANKEYTAGLVRRLDDVKSSPSFSGLSYDDRINYLILKDMLQSYVYGYEWHLYTVGNPVSFLEGPHLKVVNRFEITPFVTREDFVNFLSRMMQISDQIDDMITLMRGAISRQLTNHNASMIQVPSQIEKLITAGLDGPWFTLFKDRVDNSSLTDKDKSLLLSEAKRTVRSTLLPAYQRLKDFIVDEFLPHTRYGYGVSSLTNGTEFYKAALKWHLSVDMTANQVHDKGLQEVERISKLMTKILHKQNFTGTIKQYFDHLKADPKFHVKSEKALLERYNDIIFRRISPKLPRVFKNIPNLPVKVMPMSHDGPIGEYFAGPADGSRPSIFAVNLRRPESVNTFDMAALCMHETVPGHHLQHIFSLQTLPPYRSFLDYNHYYIIPFHLPFYTAYTEGWGLYAEFLGEQLGVYRDDYELMGRYSQEMFRACRLVVDTGIHAKGWTREQAIDYMLKFIATPRHNIEIEVDRYITWPGQACAYKIGELKLRELRETATRRLGKHFDVRDFHSTVLKHGPLPISLLEKIVNDWVEKQLAAIIPDPIG